MIGLSFKNILLLLLLVSLGWIVYQNRNAVESAPETWSSIIKPGDLSTFHSDLEKDCGACHSSYSGVERDRCVVCHAAETDLLKKQNTTFHASIGSCSGCHLEHQGVNASIVQMDHTHLVLEIAEMLRKLPAQKSIKDVSENLGDKDYHRKMPAIEKSLNCVGCHENQDKHRSFFGADCSSCHQTDKWEISSFRHPSSSSRDCSQCHQGPPSHYMMHFKMISEKVAGVENMNVSQCYACHQTTSWNDIKGVGWYKHH